MFKKILERLRGKVSDEKLDVFDIEVEGPDTPAEQLQDYKMAGIDRVAILSQRDEDVCPVCFKADGDGYPLEEAIERQILPHEGCKNDECRCSYRPIIVE